MTMAEFKAWFDGYSEAIGDVPTPEQWERIKEKIASVYPVVNPSPFAPMYPSTNPVPTFTGPWEITCGVSQ